MKNKENFLGNIKWPEMGKQNEEIVRESDDTPVGTHSFISSSIHVSSTCNKLFSLSLASLNLQ